MYEYELINYRTEETIIIWGYDLANACERFDIDINLYDVVNADYVD